MEFHSTTIIITGGCSGLGFATAQKFRSLGANVALFDINREVGLEKVQSLGSDNTMFCPVDVRKEEDVVTALTAVHEQFGSIDVLINCAGIAPAGRLLNRDAKPVSLESFQSTIDINLVGSFNVARLAASAMANNSPHVDTGQRGVIINTASVAGYEGQIGQTAYAASKAGIIGLTLPMARDLSPLGIRVNTIAPGVMGTPMLLAMPEKVQDSLSANVPYPKRLGGPDEFASLAVHIVENNYLNGETIRLDGALRMPPK